MSYILHDRNNEQVLIPFTMIRGGTSRGFYFEGKNVPPPGKGGTLTFGHRSGMFSVKAEPVAAASPNDVTFKQVAYPRTARIICDGTVYVKNERPPQCAVWREVDEITAASFYLEGDSVNIQA